MKNRKILFCDLDGTLLDDVKNICEQNLVAIKKMLAAGHVFAVCTGRPLESGKAIARQYGLYDASCYVIGYNGGTVYAPATDQVLKHASVPLFQIQKLFERAQASGLHFQTYSPFDAVLAPEKTPELEAYIKNTKLRYEIGAAAIRQINWDPAKAIVASLTDHDALRRFKEENDEWTKPVMNSFFSCEDYVEYCPKEVSKGNAVRFLCDYLQIPLSNAVAVGDERNDISMLKAAKVGAVPANCHPEARKNADYVCKNDNNHGAIAEIIEKFLLATVPYCEEKTNLQICI